VLDSEDNIAGSPKHAAPATKQAASPEALRKRARGRAIRALLPKGLPGMPPQRASAAALRLAESIHDLDLGIEAVRATVERNGFTARNGSLNQRASCLMRLGERRARMLAELRVTR